MFGLDNFSKKRWVHWVSFSLSLVHWEEESGTDAFFRFAYCSILIRLDGDGDMDAILSKS